MPTVQQTESKAGQTITFTCDPGWKRRAAAAVALRGETMNTACVEALSKYLKIDRPKSEAVA